MNIDEIIEVELEGISKTICGYTSDTFIRSYAKKILEVDYYKNPELFMKLMNRLNDWYLVESKKILENPYTFNKEGHKRSIELIQFIVNLKIDNKNV